jgi:GTP-binding protein YchF
MSFNCGIVGLPNSGKSTLFNALTKLNVPAESYPFCTIAQNVGIVTVPDSRLDEMAKIYKPPNVIPTTVEFVDIAGLVKGANKGEGLGNKFLAQIREVDAILHTVRCFQDENVSHVYETIDPVRDVEIVNYELLLKDIETVEHSLNDAKTKSKSGEKKHKLNAEFLEKLKEHLATSKLAKDFIVEDLYKELYNGLFLLTSKPVLYIANVTEKSLTGDDVQFDKLKIYAENNNSKIIKISAKIEHEISELEPSEQKLYLEEVGLKESGLKKVIQSVYELLDLISFFTHNEKELRAWTLKNGLTAPKAAGKIHSDFEKGYIKAEVIKYADIIKYGSDTAVKESGSLAIQGNDYIVKDGDILFFKFHIS